MIHITNTGSPFFEEAYFILRKADEECDTESRDMLKEAIKIADRAALDTLKKNKRRQKFKALYFLLGAAACSFVFGVIMLFATLF